MVADTAIRPETQGEFSIYRGGRRRVGSKGQTVSVSETERLQMLNEVSRALTSRLELQDVYDTVYERITRIMDAAMFFLAFRLPEEGRAHIAYLREYGRRSLDVTTPPGKSVTTHVFGLGEPLLFHSAEQYERYALSHGLPVIILGDESEGAPQSMMFAPLNTGTETIGTLSVQSTHENIYSQHDFDTLTVIAAQAAIAVQNARLYEASRDSAQRLQALVKVAETVNSSLQLSTVLDSILDGIRSVLPYHLAAIMLPDARRQRLDAVGSVGELSEEMRRSLKVPLGQGVTGKVFATGQPLVIADVTKYKGYIAGSAAVRSEAAVPLKRGSEAVGVLNIERTEVNGFKDEDIELLLLFASQAATAIENARLFEDQKTRVHQMDTIQAVVQEMTTVHENDGMAATIERGLRRLLDFNECIIYLVSEANRDGRRRLEPIGGRRARRSKVPRRARLPGEGIAGWVWENGEATIVDSTHTDPRVSHDVIEHPQEYSVMAAPLMHQDTVSGVITMGKRGAGQYDERGLSVLAILAAHAAIGFDRCRLYQELHLQATTDHLTGLFNRRHLGSRLSEEMSRALRNGHPLAAILLDADDFKAVNDTYGHEAGDAVLKALGKLLQTELRTEDIVARYGGEEFLLLLPEVDEDGAVRVGERLRNIIGATPLAAEAGVTRITVSIGVSLLEKQDKADEIIRRADLAMYESKKRGGNLLCVRRNDEYTFPTRPDSYPDEVTAA